MTVGGQDDRDAAPDSARWDPSQTRRAISPSSGARRERPEQHLGTRAMALRSPRRATAPGPEAVVVMHAFRAADPILRLMSALTQTLARSRIGRPLTVWPWEKRG